eukprot:scaffold4174_cov182-Ochromonas_danica.AAC.1
MTSRHSMMQSTARSSQLSSTRMSSSLPLEGEEVEDDDRVREEDEEEEVGGGGEPFFKTAIDLSTRSIVRGAGAGGRGGGAGGDSIYRLPPVVNFVALRETFLSEAPFVKRSNRLFWKKWIDSRQYSQALALSLLFITNCISENGAVHLDRLYQIENSLLIEKMAGNISEMLTLDRDLLHQSHAHDLLFTRLPEVFAYMILNSLLASLPKLARVYYTGQFREILLDWLDEVIGGLRKTDCRRDRDWLFADCTKNNVVVIHNTGAGGGGSTSRSGPPPPPPTGGTSSRGGTSGEGSSPSSPLLGTSGGGAGGGGRLPALKRQGTIRSGPSSSSYTTTNNQPFASSSTPQQEQEGTSRDSTGAAVPFKLFPVVLEAQAAENRYRDSHDLSRFGRATSCFLLQNSPLVKLYLRNGRSSSESHQCQHPLKISNFREKRINNKRLQQVLKSSGQHRVAILEEVKRKDQEVKRDLLRIKHAYQIQIDLLNKKPVSQKQLLAAATTIEQAKVAAAGGGNGGGGGGGNLAMSSDSNNNNNGN